MPRPTETTVTLKKSTALLLDRLPGRSRKNKVEKLIEERALNASKVDGSENSREIAIARIKFQVDNGDLGFAWRILEIILERIKGDEDASLRGFLEKILMGEKPTDAELIELGQKEDLPEDSLFRLRDRLFSKKKNGNQI